MDDQEFFDKQEPFTLGEQRGIAVTVNTLVVRTHLSGGSGGLAGGGARLMEAAVKLLRALQTRDSRRSFTPAGLWLAPAAAAPRWGGAGRPWVFAVDPTCAFRNFQRLKLLYDKMLSNFAFNCNLRHFSPDPRGARRLRPHCTPGAGRSG